MEGRNHPGKRFRRGVVTGIFSTLALVATIYILNMLGLVAVSVSSLPDVQEILGWAYYNLRLSIIPFTLILILYFRALYQLKRLLSDPNTTPEQVAQAENWVNISISLFFGVGVIWTAIGMRSALIAGLGDLDGTTAAQLGSFEILRRLIEGGILLALSTTIFGAAGGYLMRLNKILLIGAALLKFYSHQTRIQTRIFERRLENIESYLSEMVNQVEATKPHQNKDDS